MADATFSLMATTTASTKRPPDVSGGKRTAPAQNIASLSCYPLVPVDAQLRERMHTEGMAKLWQTFVQGGLDILEGDLLVIGSTEYPVRYVEEWDWFPDSADRLLIVVEELKT
jgi:hypothetical protein